MFFVECCSIISQQKNKGTNRYSANVCRLSYSLVSFKINHF
ncbi:hypothetical protein HMPREF0454_04702 [Hafnia alvei ATCC 51873]|uniref:Uncharacterized protein n=1 Tax=Hafnia alvei ATCC 51873 TaxID=1002364 RepID=G9YDJ9_HAFAL|nr:hypothetical protein HMPREF0454_04702 [Hafnia alvei ATCC 51873]